MEINEELFVQWEPKIQKMCSTIWVSGYDREDLAQELRISLMKSANAYDENRGASFHTYLHSADLMPLDIVKALTDGSDFTLDFDVTDEVFSCGLSAIEQKFLVLRLEGLTMEEITEDLGEPAYKIRQSLRKKILDGTNLHEKYSVF